MTSIVNELAAIAAALPADAAARCAARIEEHERVFVYGAGRSGLMLRALAMRLAQMGKTAYVVGETVTPAVASGDLLILASASGTTHSVCRYARIAADLGVDLLVISAREESELASIRQPDVVFAAPTKDSGAGKQVMGSLFEQSLLLFGDAVVSCIHADPALMRRNHANLE